MLYIYVILFLIILAIGSIVWYLIAQRMTLKNKLTYVDDELGRIRDNNRITGERLEKRIYILEKAKYYNVVKDGGDLDYNEYLYRFNDEGELWITSDSYEKPKAFTLERATEIAKQNNLSIKDTRTGIITKP